MNNSEIKSLRLGTTAVKEARRGTQLVLAPNGDQLWYKANERPSLDLRFADNKSLVDAATGQNLVTFTRASSGTYVGSDGLIKTATTNLLLRSEEFETSWTRNGLLAFGSGSVSNATGAPNGSITADLITEDTSASTPHRLTQSSLTVSAVSCTISVYAKRANGTRNLEINANALTNARAVFNLGDGTIGEITSGTASMQAVGNGWYRCSVTGTSSGTTSSLFLQLATGTTSASSTYTGDGTSGIYIWGAQLEQSSTVGEYIPTTSTINSAPRFDHNPTTGASLGLLVEESRTNLFQYSEEFNNAYWSKTNVAGTVTANQAVAPDGATTADLYQEDTATTGRYLSRAIAYTSGTIYTISCWAKQAPGATRYLGLVFPSPAFGSSVNASFTLSGTGSFVIATSGTNTSAQIQALPNGWYRCTLASQATTTTSAGVQLRLSNSATSGVQSYAGDGTSGIYLWGAQLEAGAFPTSYIPTTTATVTRSADVASITGADFSSWYRQDEGTVFSQAILPPGAFNTIVNINTTNNDTITSRTTATQANFNVVVSGTTQTGALNISYSPYTVLKSVGCYALNNFALSANGATPVTDATGTVPAVIQANIGRSAANNNYTNGTIARLAYWPQRLPNETLQAVTQ